MDAGTVEGAIAMRDLATRVIERVDETMARLEKRLGDTEQAAKKFANGYERVGAVLERTGSRLESLGLSLTAAITVPLAGAALASGKFASDFEKSMAQVVTLSGITEDSMKDMRRQILELGPAVGKGPNELAKGLLVVTSTGLKGAGAIEVLTAAAKASAVGLGEVNDVARAITSAVTAYGQENLSAARAADILFETVRQGGAEANELAGVLGRVVGIASQVGVSFEEVGAFIATYTRLGVDAAEATTGIRAVLTTLLQPTKEAEGALQSLGTSVQGLREAVAEKGLSKALIDLTESAKGNEEALAAVFGNVRALAGVMGAAGSQASALEDGLKKISNSGGELDKAFDRMKNTTAQTFSEFRAQVETVSIAVGDRLAPAFSRALRAAEPLINAVGKMADLFGDLPGPIQTATLGLLGIFAAAGPLAFTIGGTLDLVGKLSTAFGQLAKTQAVVTAMTAIQTALTGIGSAAATSTIAVAGLKAGLVGLGAAGIVITIAAAADALKSMREATETARTAAELAEKNFRQITDILGYQPASIQEAETALKAYSLGLRGMSIEALKGSQVTTTIIEAFEKGRAASDKLSPAVRTVVENFAGFGKAAGKVSPVVKTLSDDLEAYRKVLAKLSDAKKADIKAGLEMGKSAEDIATRVGVAVEVVQLYEDALRKTADQTKKTREEQEAFADTMNDVREAAMKADQVLEDLQLKEEAKEGAESFGEMKDQIAQVAARLDEAFGDTEALDETLSAIRAINQQFAEIMDTNVPQGGLLKQIFGSPAQFGADLGNVITSAFSGGGNIGKSIGGFLGGSLGQIATGLTAGIGGLLGGLLNSILPGIGSLLGGLGLDKLLGKLFKTEQRKVNDLRDAWEDQFESFDELNRKANEAGLTLDRYLKAETVEEYEAAIDELEKAFKAVEDRVKKVVSEVADASAQGKIIGKELWAAILNDKGRKEVQDALKDLFESSVDRAAQGFNKIATNFVTLVTGFRTGSDDLERVLEGIAEKGKDGFAGEFLTGVKEQLGTIGPLAEAAFGALLAKGLSVVEALNVLGPGLGTIRQVLEATNIQAEGFLGQILGWEGIVSANKELFEILSGVDDMLVGLSNSGLLTQDSFNALATIVGDGFNSIVAGGADADTALRLLQPQLQKLWEASQTWNLELDEGTQKLLEQAEAGGLIGDQFKPAAERMVDGINTLIGRLDILITHLGGKLPAAAEDGAADVENALNSIKVDPITIPIDYDFPDRGGMFPPMHDEPVPQLAEGGIARRATPAIVGEAGPEAIIPLDELYRMLDNYGGGGNGATVNMNLTIQGWDGTDIRRTVRSREFQAELADAWALGLGRTEARIGLNIEDD